LAIAAYVRRVLRVENPHWRRALRVAPVIIALLPFSLFLISIVWSNVAPPPVLYERVFDRKAGRDVHDLEGASDATNDAQHVYLAFRISPEAQSLLTNGLRPLAADSADGKVPIAMEPEWVPAWWTAAHCRDRTVFSGESVRQWDEIVVTECRSDGRTYVEAYWIE
jgi:hypothetical protein